MQLRNSVFQAAALATLLVACGGRDGNPDGGDAGCIGVCNNDGGQDAGGDGGVCSGIPADMGTVTVEQLRAMPVCGQKVTVRNVVVNHINFVYDAGFPARCTTAGASESEFWVAAGDGGAGGFYVNKYCDDAPAAYVPELGHKLIVSGYLYEPFAKSFPKRGPPHSQDRTGYRLEVGAQSEADPSVPFGTNTMTLTGLSGGNAFMTAAPDETWSSDGGAVIAHDEMRGTRVHIPGPVYLEDAAPTFMLRYNAEYTDAGSPLYLKSGRNNYFGFTVSGGIPIFDALTRLTSSGTPPKGHTTVCDWRSHYATDGGSNRLVFPEGITGVWDSVTMVPFVDHCPDGGTAFVDCVPSGYIPDVDGGLLGDRINAVYVTDCADYGDAGFVP